MTLEGVREMQEKGLENAQFGMCELPASHDGRAHSQSNGCGGEDATCPCEPTGKVAGKIGIFLRCKLVCPEILTSCIGQRRCQF